MQRSPDIRPMIAGDEPVAADAESRALADRLERILAEG